mgnify:CR=1 FL=1
MTNQGKAKSTRVETSKAKKCQVKMDRADSADTSKKPKGKGRHESAKTPIFKSIDPEAREDAVTSRKSYHRGESSERTPDISGSTNADRTRKPIEGSESINTTLRRSRRARRLTKFYQSGLDYINYTDAGEPSTYEEAMAAIDAKTW